MGSELHDEMQTHMAEPFPESITRGDDYGEVDVVMIGADIYGWGDSRRIPSADERRTLSTARDELVRSIPDFPDEAKPYYERLISIATLTLSH